MIKVKPAGVAVYPEAKIPDENWLERQTVNILGRALRHREVRRSALSKIVACVNAAAEGLQEQDNTQLTQLAQRARESLVREGFSKKAVATAFALIREVADRQLGMRHFDVQLLGGYALLKGVIAEMQTGEGKTLTATLAAATAALAGWPVHVITVNDYLAGRDAEEMAPIYRALGLSVGVIQHEMSPAERRAAYACDITYCSNKELTFDYLKDRIALGLERNRARLSLERLYKPQSRLDQLLLRGLHFAIVDEADSVLVDEARTPLILSRERAPDANSDIWAEALELAQQLDKTKDFIVDHEDRQAWLTARGEDQVVALAADRGGIWSGRNRSLELVTRALFALYLFHRDEHYVVLDDKVQIVDEYTGRLMADRSWEAGLHQMIEAKEAVPISGEKKLWPA